MKRLALCAFIMAAVIFSSVFSLVMLDSASDELYVHIDDCLEAYYSGDEGIEEKIDSLEVYWGEYYVKASFLTRSSSLDDVSCTAARLMPLLKENGEEFTAELNSIRYRAFLLYESQVPHWRSVF